MLKLKTYILNYAPLTDRAAWMDTQLKLAYFENYEFYKEDTDYSFYNYYNESLAERHSRVTSKTYVPRRLSKAEFDLIRKHQQVLINGYASKAEWILVLEDDALLKDGYCYKSLLNKIDNAPKDCDIIIAGGPFDHSLCTYSDQATDYLLANHPATNTSSSIIYRRDSIPMVAVSLQRAQLPLDWELNFIYKNNNLKVWHMFPYLFSQNKNFKSSIQ